MTCLCILDNMYKFHVHITMHMTTAVNFSHRYMAAILNGGHLVLDENRNSKNIMTNVHIKICMT